MVSEEFYKQLNCPLPAHLTGKVPSIKTTGILMKNRQKNRQTLKDTFRQIILKIHYKYSSFLSCLNNPSTITILVRKTNPL